MAWRSTSQPPLAVRPGVEFRGRSLNIRPSQVFDHFDSLSTFTASSADPRLGISIDRGTLQNPKSPVDWELQLRATGGDRVTDFLLTGVPAVGEAVTALIVLRVE